jgi:outer membrane protein OmpA-like peptidoglycan-associated protein
MRLRTALLAAAFAVASSGAAQAGQINGWYLSLEGGANWIEDWSHTRVPGAVPSLATLDTGWAVLSSAGYGWRGWRFEFEAGYRDNDLDSYFSPGLFPTVIADVWEASFMANALYDITLTNNLSLSLGAGAGGDFADVEFSFGGPASFEADNWSFAYQGIAGLNYGIGRRTALFLNYRYMRIIDHEFDFRPAIGVFLTNGDDIVKHTATIGIRYALYAPAVMSDVAPPPPDPGPTAVPRQFIVFFGFNKYNLTSEALRVISEAVVAAKETGSATVLITGHTDTVGSNGYNQRLSMRRSNVVKAEMVRQGVAPGQIQATGKGELELLVQTADGVKEPQNRRSTIDLN